MRGFSARFNVTFPPTMLTHAMSERIAHAARACTRSRALASVNLLD